MSDTIRFTKTELKEAITSVLHTLIKEENNLSNGGMRMDTIPSFPHTERAFAVGDILYIKGRVKQDTEDGGSKMASSTMSGKILSIENGTITVDKLKKTIDVKSPQILSTDTWLKFYEIFSTRTNNMLPYSNTIFDYETINGELYVTMSARVVKTSNTNSNIFKKGVKYADLKSSDNPPMINIKVENEQSKTDFYCPKNSVEPFKTKNPQPEATPVNIEWIRTINDTKFGGWMFAKAKEIVHAMPWLFDNEALWFDPKSNKSKRLVLRDFINSRSQQ